MLGMMSLRTALGAEAAAGLFIQFDGYLRPSKLLELVVDDVILPRVSAGPTYRLAAVIVRQSGDPECAWRVRLHRALPVTPHSLGLVVLAALVQRAKRSKRQALFPSMTLPQ